MGWFSNLWPFGSKAPSEAPESHDPPHDEDVMIEALKLHKAIKKALIHRLKEEGIHCQATTNNDPQGDVVIIKKKDVPRVQQIIRQLHG